MSKYLLLPGCLAVLLGLVAQPRAAESSNGSDQESPADLAQRCFQRYWNLSEVVLNKHFDPPTRQEMFLAGVRGLFAQAKVTPPDDLSRQVSRLVTEDQFAAYLKENWPAA